MEAIIAALILAGLERLSKLAQLQAKQARGEQITEEDRAMVRAERDASFDDLDEAIRNAEV